MGAYRVISSDSHIIEPPDLWTARVEGRFITDPKELGIRL